MATQSPKTDKYTEPKYSELFDFWNNLPVIKKVGAKEYNTIGDHNYRNAMIQILRRGITGANGRRRRALSLKELVEPMEEFIAREFKITEAIKITALYHHRDILLEEGLIKEVATILEGKRYVTYYGRTAKAFIGDFQGSMKEKEGSVVLSKLLNKLHKNEDLETVNPLLSSFEGELDRASQLATQWIEDHVELINELDLDAIILYEIIYPFFAYNSAVSASIRELLNS